MAETLLLSYQRDDVKQPQPWPVAVDLQTSLVTSGLGPDDGAFLIGFGPAGEQRITVYLAAAVEKPEVVTGMTATFSKDDNLFLWNIPIADAKIIGQP
jgi:hypothetical protein